MSVIGKREAPQGPVDHTGERVPDWVFLNIREAIARGVIPAITDVKFSIRFDGPEIHNSSWRRHESQSIRNMQETAYSCIEKDGSNVLYVGNNPNVVEILEREAAVWRLPIVTMMTIAETNMDPLQAAADRCKAACAHVGPAIAECVRLGLHVDGSIGHKDNYVEFLFGYTKDADVELRPRIFVPEKTL